METIINLLILLANITILGLNLKLYTEYFKDRSIAKRKVLDPAVPSKHIDAIIRAVKQRNK